jgi:ribosomal protein L40E
LGNKKGYAVALIKCKECGNEISSKAETCPKCGLRFKASPKSNSEPGCIVSLFKLIGGLVGGAIGLMIAISLLSNQNPTTPIRQLEIRCEEASKTQSGESEQKSFYESCMSSGSSQIRAQERINGE